ncbi:MAG: hypothetical protein EOO74_03130, partial [Myxococcales bacterium]
MTPLRRRPQRMLAAAALVLAAPAFAACGFNVQTDQQYQAAVGVDDRSAVVDVLNAVIVTEKDGEGAFVATFTNNSVDTPHKVLSIQADGGEATVLGKEIAPEGLLSLADEEAPVTITGDGVAPGKFVKVTIEFDNGEQTTVNAPVV